MHLRIADLMTESNSVVRKVLLVKDFSKNVSNPTLTQGESGQLLASVFVSAMGMQDIAVSALLALGR
jgi:hypothetical protein